MPETRSTIRSSLSTPSPSIKGLLTALVVLGVALLGPDRASGQVFYERGFTYELAGEDRAHSITDAILVGGFLIHRIGDTHISAVNVESQSERWRFTSKTGSIRKMHHRGELIVVEAEHLVALEAASGRERWNVPLNCYSGSKCNTRVRVLTPETIVLSGFDGRDDNLMVLDGTGVRQWPNWVEVPGAQEVVFTPATIVVATSADPYAVIGLDRFTGRERWRFRPEGTDKPAVGLLHSGNIVTTWWTSRAADSVYSIALDTGKPLTDWIVTRSARDRGELRGGGPGFFFAYQPSLSGGGRARAWDVRTGEPLWRIRLTGAQPPRLVGPRVFSWATQRNRTALTSLDAQAGTEVWRFERKDVDAYEALWDSPRVLLRMIGKPSVVAALDVLSGRVLGVGPLEPALETARLRWSNGDILAFDGPRLVQLAGKPGRDLVFQFNEHVENGQIDEANALHRTLRPFVDNLEAAAVIHRRVVSRQYREITDRMESGSFSAVLQVIERASADENMMFYEDFRGFMAYLKAQVEERDTSERLRGRDLTRLRALGNRVVELIVRYERKLGTGEDTELFSGIQVVIMTLSEMLARAGSVEDAHKLLHELWSRGWADRTDDLKAQITVVVRSLVQKLLPALDSAVGRGGQGADAALLEILAIEGLELVLPNPPSAASIPDMTLDDYANALGRLKGALRPD